MQQFVTIFVLCGAAGRQLFEEVEARLTTSGLEWDRDAMINEGQLAYWNCHLDLWSMGDSFERFIESPKGLQIASAGAHQLVCCRREEVRIRKEARNEEEARMQEILQQARDAYRGATSESYLFQVRSVFDASKGFNPAVPHGGGAGSGQRTC